MNATKQQIRSYLDESTKALQALFDNALANLTDVTLDARQNIAAEASLALWAHWHKVPIGMSRDNDKITVRPLGELGPVFTVLRAVRT